MVKITTSVGKGGANSRPDDIRLVQKLLNGHVGAAIGALVTDGSVGPKTIAAIEYFQRCKMHVTHPDGRVDVNGATIKALGAGGAGAPPPPANYVVKPPPTNETGSYSSAQQKQALVTAAKLYVTAGGNGGMCARYTYNLAHNYVKSLRGKPLHTITNAGSLLPAGGNANQQGYHSNLKVLGYSESMISADCSKEDLKKFISTTQYNIGDVLVYWGLYDDAGMSGNVAADGHWKYGHTQLFTAGAIDSAYRWASDPKNNYGASFVYNNQTRYPGNNWALKILRAPAA